MMCVGEAMAVMYVGECERERNVLFNDALNILSTVIWHQTYG